MERVAPQFWKSNVFTHRKRKKNKKNFWGQNISENQAKNSLSHGLGTKAIDIARRVIPRSACSRF